MTAAIMSIGNTLRHKCNAMHIRQSGLAAGTYNHIPTPTDHIPTPTPTDHIPTPTYHFALATANWLLNLTLA